MIEGGGKRDERVAEKKKSKKAKEKKSEAKVEATVTEPDEVSCGITGDYFGEMSWHIKRDKDLHRSVATVFPKIGLEGANGESVIAGSIVVRQPGDEISDGVGVGRDYTLYARQAGVLNSATAARLAKSRQSFQAKSKY